VGRERQPVGWRSVCRAFEGSFPVEIPVTSADRLPGV